MHHSAPCQRTQAASLWWWEATHDARCFHGSRTAERRNHAGVLRRRVRRGFSNSGMFGWERYGDCRGYEPGPIQSRGRGSPYPRMRYCRSLPGGGVAAVSCLPYVIIHLSVSGISNPEPRRPRAALCGGSSGGHEKGLTPFGGGRRVHVTGAHHSGSALWWY